VATTELVCASSVSKQHSAAAISPNGNNKDPVIFTTYSK
jgi:hypothetical protein